MQAMTTAQFIEELKTKFRFKKQSKDFALVNLEKDQILAYNNKNEIRAINFLEIRNDALGFGIDRVLDLESTNELVFVSGTETKNGLYYLDHESSLITVEELENDEDASAWIEDWLAIDLNEYAKLSPDLKFSLIEEESEMRFLAKTFEEFLEKISVVSVSDFRKM